MKVVSLAFALLGTMSCPALQRSKSRSYQPIPTQALDSDIESNCELTDIVVESSVYHLVLSDGQRWAFEKNLLEKSDVLSMLAERSLDYTISVPADIIPSSPAEDVVTLADLHEILRVIAENENPEQGLRKLLLSDISATRALNLLHLATFYNIQPLFEIIKEQFAVRSLKEEAWEKQMRNIFSEYAQKEVVAAHMVKDPSTIETMLHNDDVRTPIWRELFYKFNTYVVRPTGAFLKDDRFLVFTCLDGIIRVYDIHKNYVFEQQIDIPMHMEFQRRNFDQGVTSPNGAFRVSLSDDKKQFQMWGATKNILLYTLPVHIVTKDYVRGSFGDVLHVDYILWLPDSKAFIYNIRCGAEERDVFYNEIYLQRILTAEDFPLAYDEMKAFKNGDSADLPAHFAKALESRAQDKRCCTQVMNVIKNHIYMFWRHKYQTIGMLGCGVSLWLILFNPK